MKHTDLNELIAQLEGMVDEANPQKGYWARLWALSKSIGYGFKDTRYPTIADKNEAWDEYQRLRTKAEERSARQRERIEQNEAAWTERKQRSEQALNRISWHTSQARPLNNLERGIGEMLLLPLLIVERILNDLLGVDSKDGLFSIRRELLACNEQLKQAWTVFNEHKESMVGSDKAEAFKSLNAAREKLDHAWSEWKNANQRLFATQQAAWEERKREREAKRQHFVERVNENIDKLEEKVAKARGALEHQESHLEELKEKLEDARSESFRERCSSWIEECEERIVSIREHIERMEGWREEEKSKLR